MAKKSLSQAAYVERGYGQVEPNHLSAQLNGQVYAQLPADAEIEILENGQFVKYDYEKGLVNFTGEGDWMLVFNEVKVYRNYLGDADFAMIKDNYGASVYSPAGNGAGTIQLRNYKNIAKKEDELEIDSTQDPFANVALKGKEVLMPTKTTMVPRVLGTHVGDIYTTNMIGETDLVVGDELKVNDKGILAKSGTSDMAWKVVKVYTMPDMQKGVKLIRVK